MENEKIESLTTENNIEIKFPKVFIDAIKQGCLFEVAKKKKDTSYTYLSKNTLASLLFLSKENISYPLKNLISKNDFAEFYYDLGYTDLKTVFWLDINGKKENLYRYYEVFLKYQEQVEGEVLDVERTMPVEIINLFYDHIKDYYVGLYSTVESLFQFLLFEKYNIKISKEIRTKDDIDLMGLYNFITYNKKFVSNQIADDILQEYIDDFENCKLNEDKSAKIINPFTNEELAEADEIRKSDLTDEEKNKRLAKFSSKEMDAYTKGRALSKKEDTTNYYNYNKLLLMVGDIFGSDYENCGNILNINNKTLLNKQDILKCDIEQIRLYELLLSLEKSKSIIIRKISCKNHEFTINIEFLKNPKDVSKDTENWTTYGDLRVNKDLGIAQYKNKPIKKFQKGSNKFKVLCYLIDHPDTKVDVDTLVDLTKLANDVRWYRKMGKSNKEIKLIRLVRMNMYIDKLKDYINDIQKELGILDDQERTIQISQSKPAFILHKI